MSTDVFDQKMRLPIRWRKTDVPYVFNATIDGELFTLRLNDFPAEPLCTFTYGDTQMHLDDFPESWILPWREKQKTQE